MSTAYSRLYGLSQTGLRFFTVYGPWGRPDMAYFSFAQKITAGEPIDVFGEGRMARDFTYIDDIIDGVLGVADHPAAPGENRLFNIGDSRPVGLMRMIEVLEQALGKTAVKRMQPMQPGDVSATFANVGKLKLLCDYAPKIALEDGLPKFVQWFQTFAL
jgi:UDP-glucuronate 4-epimerase